MRERPKLPTPDIFKDLKELFAGIEKLRESVSGPLSAFRDSIEGAGGRRPGRSPIDWSRSHDRTFCNPRTAEATSEF